jgi:hypothetical protein
LVEARFGFEAVPADPPLRNVRIRSYSAARSGSASRYVRG